MNNFSLTEINEKISERSKFVADLKKNMSNVVSGQSELINKLIIAMLANGHILLEGLPGLAKTLMVKTLSNLIKTDFQRIQFTPDMLPADLLGTLVYNQKSGEFDIRKGPIFSNIILADEINRSPAKVQSALLEAMQERQITIGEETFLLDKNVIDKFLNKFLVSEEEKNNSLFNEICLSTNILVIKIAVNKEVIIPIKSVVAKPLIGPEPKINKINAVRPVVILASRIEDNALLKPSDTACFKPFSLYNSSLTLSKIKTFASTDIPMVSTIPAIPGRVKTAPKPDRKPNIKTILRTKATSAYKPARP